MIDYSLGNFFKPSAIAIKSLGLACPAQALPASLSKSPIALSKFWVSIRNCLDSIKFVIIFCLL